MARTRPGRGSMSLPEQGWMLPVFNLDPGCCPLAIAGERFALIESNCRCWGPNGVSEWVWRAGALRM